MKGGRRQRWCEEIHAEWIGLTGESETDKKRGKMASDRGFQQLTAEDLRAPPGITNVILAADQGFAKTPADWELSSSGSFSTMFCTEMTVFQENERWFQILGGEEKIFQSQL